MLSKNTENTISSPGRTGVLSLSFNVTCIYITGMRDVNFEKRDIDSSRHDPC